MDDIIEEKDGRFWLHAEISREHAARVTACAIKNDCAIGDVIDAACDDHFLDKRHAPRRRKRDGE